MTITIAEIVGRLGASLMQRRMRLFGSLDKMKAKGLA
jgi:hypothetical protein